jgi:hypothetical protein
MVLYKWDIGEVYGQESRETNVIVRRARRPEAEQTGRHDCP